MNPKLGLVAVFAASAIIASLIAPIGELIAPFSAGYPILMALAGLALGFLTQWDVGAALMVMSSLPLTLTVLATANAWMSEARGHETEAGVVGSVFFLCFVFYILAGVVTTFVGFKIGRAIRAVRS